MMLKNVSSLLRFGNSEWGEDRIVLGKNLFAVIDGATPIDAVPFEGFHTQAEWLAETTKEFLERQEAALFFPEKMFDFAKRIHYSSVRNKIDKEYNIPSATLAVAMLRGKFLDIHVIGDAGIIVFTKDGKMYNFEDKRIKPFSELTLKVASESNAVGEERLAVTKQQRIKNRLKMNTKNGYWTFSPVGDFRKEFINFTFLESTVSRCIIYTDGFAQVCNTCGVETQSLSKEYCPDICKLTEDCINHICNSKTESQNFIKKLDDVSVIVLDF